MNFQNKKIMNYDFLFDIFDKWLICNDNNDLDLFEISNLLKIIMI